MPRSHSAVPRVSSDWYRWARARLLAVTAIRNSARRLSPARRRVDAQWRRIDQAVDVHTVQSGPFMGMRLTTGTTGSHIPKRLGCYESELHRLVEGWSGYDRIIDVGCGEGWYVVGLGRRMPDAEIWGFDISENARAACRTMAAANGVDVHLAGAATPTLLDPLIRGRVLLIVDAEGAEVDVLDPDLAPALRRADILIELHDFARPGATKLMLERFADRRATFVEQSPRNPSHYSLLGALAECDQRRAVDESRVPDQRWLWLPARSE